MHSKKGTGNHDYKTLCNFKERVLEYFSGCHNWKVVTVCHYTQCAFCLSVHLECKGKHKVWYTPQSWGLVWYNWENNKVSDVYEFLF